MFIDYISNLENALSLCDLFETSVKTIFFDGGQIQESSDPGFVSSRVYRDYFEPIKACVELCRILKLQFQNFEYEFYNYASSLEKPGDTRNLKELELNLRAVRLGFRIVNKEVSAFCLAFDDEEKIRINEAIHNHFEDCNFSCVAMSVSAVESRLLKLMCLVSPQSEQELEKKTLGQLIYEYVTNKDSYKNVVPEKHEPLLQLCNTYRTFSVHPKKQRITSRLATSILNLAIEFLTDQNTKPEVVKAQLSASGEDK
jgi:hypothetical protein